MLIYATIQGPSRIFAPGGTPNATSITNPLPFTVVYKRGDGVSPPADKHFAAHRSVLTLAVTGPPAVTVGPTISMLDSEWILIVRATSQDLRLAPVWAYDNLDDIVGEDYAMLFQVIYTGEILFAQQF